MFPYVIEILPNFHSCFYNCMETRERLIWIRAPSARKDKGKPKWASANGKVYFSYTTIIKIFRIQVW